MNKKIAAGLLILFIAIIGGGFGYWRYSNAYGRTRTFVGTITLNPLEGAPCAAFEINEDTIVRAACDGRLNIAAFEGDYDKTLNVGDKVEVKATRFNPNGGTFYRMYDIRGAGTYIRKAN